MTEITGNGTLVTGLGGEAGYGEINVGTDNFEGQKVDVSAVFEAGFFVGGQEYSGEDFLVSPSGFIELTQDNYTYSWSYELNGGYAPMFAAFIESMDFENVDANIYVDLDTVADVVTITYLNGGPYEYDLEYGSFALNTGTNSFQIQLFDTDDGFDVVYRYQDIGFGGYVDEYLGDEVYYPATGVSFGDGTSIVPEISETAAMFDLATMEGNTGETGLWVFSVLEPLTITGTDGDDTLAQPADADPATPARMFGLDGNDTLTGGPGMDTLDGGGGGDVATGGGEADRILGGEGDDSLSGEGGNDEIYGDAGDDTLDGGEGDDVLNGGAGANVISGGAGNDYVEGGADDDDLSGNDGDDVLDGYAGDDMLDGGAGNDDLYGGSGGDFLSGGDGNDYLSAGSGADTLMGGAGHDDLYGDTGSELLDGGDGNDNLDGWVGDDTLIGGAGEDTLSGGQGAKMLIGGAGGDIYRNVDADDTIVELAGDSGIDTLSSSQNIDLRGAHIEVAQLQGGGTTRAIGNGGDNMIIGSYGNNIIDGGNGNDTMMGGYGNDMYFVRDKGDVVIDIPGEGRDAVNATISYKLGLGTEVLFLKGGDDINAVGNASDNYIVGNMADNLIIGREGNDVLDGQGGADTFVFDRALGDSNVDRIRDFNLNQADEGDILMIKAVLFGGMSTGTLDADRFHLGTQATTAEHRFVFDQAAGELWVDADGSGAGAQQLVATFLSGAEVSAEDILLY